MLLLSSTLLFTHPTSTTLFPVLSKLTASVLSFEDLTDNSSNPEMWWISSDHRQGFCSGRSLDRCSRLCWEGPAARAAITSHIPSRYTTHNRRALPKQNVKQILFHYRVMIQSCMAHTATLLQKRKPRLPLDF
jgi:hypothetical protein